MIQSSRKPAVAVLLATIAGAFAYIYNTGADAHVSDGPSLAQLEEAITNPDASMETWQLYAQRLHQEKRYAHAATAYQRVLEEDPYSRAANLQCAVALANASDPDRLHDFMGQLLLVEPRLALDVFARPELQAYLAQERFRSLHAQAHAQSLD